MLLLILRAVKVGAPQSWDEGDCSWIEVTIEVTLYMAVTKQRVSMAHSGLASARWSLQQGVHWLLQRMLGSVQTFTDIHSYAAVALIQRRAVAEQLLRMGWTAFSELKYPMRVMLMHADLE